MKSEEQGLDGPRQPPASGGKAKQLVVLLHGLGADGNDLISLAPLLAEALPDAGFLSPHAPFPCDMAPMGRQWFSLQDMSMERMLEGAETAAPLLNAFLDGELAAHGLRPQDLALLGFSQGTMMALHVGLRRAEGLAAIIGFSGLLIAPSRLSREIAARPPVTLVHGTDDMVVPFQAMEMAEKGLEAAGVRVESFARPGLAHGIDQEGLTIAALHLQRAFSGSS